MKIPVSLLSSYLYCPRKLFLQQVLALEEPPRESLVLGSIKHETYDRINKNEEQLVSGIDKLLTFEEIENIYKIKYLALLQESILKNQEKLEEVNLSPNDAYKKSHSFVLGESLVRSHNILSFIEANNVFGEELWKRLTPKIISELKVESDKLRLKGVVDQVHVYEADYVPYELKTGSMPKDGVWPSHRIQLVAYSLLLSEKFEKKVEEGFVFYLETGKKRRISINPFMEQEVRQIVDDIIEMIGKRKVPNYCDNENKCRKCSLKQTCHDEEAVSDLLNLKIAGL